MLAWEVFVFSDKAAKSEDLIVRWMTSVLGLSWLDQLVEEGKASDLGGNGYPNRYSITAGVLFPILNKGLPKNHSPQVFGDDYVLPAAWNGELIWKQKPEAYAPETLLFLNVWDQS
jgi:hypothetical protein